MKLLTKVTVLFIVSIFLVSKTLAQTQDEFKVNPAVILVDENVPLEQKYTLRLFGNIQKTYLLNLVYLYRVNEQISIAEITSDEVNSWFEFQKEIAITPNVENIVDITVKIPYEVALGNYNFALVVDQKIEGTKAPTDTEATGQVLIPFIFNLRSLDREVPEILDISKFLPQPIFNVGSEEDFNIDLTNSGFTFFIPRGVLEITPVLALNYNEQINIQVNGKEKTLLKDETRNFSEARDFENVSGLFKANLTVVYGKDNTVLTDEKYFLIIQPPVFIIICIVFLIVFFSIFSFIFRRRNAKNN